MATRKLGPSSWFVFLIVLLVLPFVGGCDEDAGPTSPSTSITAPGDAAADPRGPATTTPVPGPVAFDQIVDLMSTEACALPTGNYGRFARRMVEPAEGAHPLTSEAGFEPCDDAPEDPQNNFTWSRAGDGFAWTATVPVGAVILQSGSASRVYVYGQRSWGDGGLFGPTDAMTGAPLPLEAVVLVHDYAVHVETQIEARLVTRIDWTLQGTATGTDWELFPGDRATSRIDLQLDASAPVVEPATVVGTVTITNDTPLTAHVASVTNFFSGGYLIAINFQVALPVDLLPGQTLVGNYWQPLPNQQTRSNNVTVNCVGDVRGGSARATLEFGERVTEGATALVLSSDGRSFGPFTASTALSVEREFTAENDGPATLQVPWEMSLAEDQERFATTITLRRHDPLLELTAESRFERRWVWSLAHGLVSEDLAPHTTSRESTRAWLRAWTDGGTDADFGVDASLRLGNPHPTRALELASSSLQIGSALQTPFADGVSVEAGSDRTIASSLPLENGTALEVDATVGYVTRSFDPDGSSVPHGFAQLGASVALSFDEPSSTIDASAWLGDTLAGDLGQGFAAASPIIVEYVVPLDTAAECGASRVEGAARLLTVDSNELLVAPYSISVEIDCEEATGCTKGQGYWKHRRDHPAWPIVLAECGAWFARNGRPGQSVLRSASKGDPYWQLAAAWITARLNQRAGADASVIAPQLEAAARLLEHERPKRLRGREAEQWRALARTLQAFNEGRIGPGACED